MNPGINNIKVVEAARDLLKAHGYFVENLWHVRDIHFICEQYNLTKLSDTEAMEVFHIANDQFDGDSGLSWPELEKALFVFLHRKAVLHGMCETNDDSVSLK
ncbi:MAG: hypothetical protein ACN2B6_10085 [Rickettsiales bacterium]